MTSNQTPSILDELSDAYREHVEGASLDWLVAEHVRLLRIVHVHSSNEIKAAAVAEVGRRDHGEEFDRLVAAY